LLGMPVDLDVPEAMRRVARLEHSPGRPADTTSSTIPAGNGAGRNANAGRRWSVVTEPAASRCSPWVSTSRVPAGPRRPSRTHPLTFRPRSTTCRPGAGRMTSTGTASSTRRAAAPACPQVTRTRAPRRTREPRSRRRNPVRSNRRVGAQGPTRSPAMRIGRNDVAGHRTPLAADGRDRRRRRVVPTRPPGRPTDRRTAAHRPARGTTRRKAPRRARSPPRGSGT
jgi:hypothetical protein